MNVAFFSPFALYSTPHFETELELMERHLREGDSVAVLACGGELEACDVNPQHMRIKCAECIGRRQAGLKLLSGTVAVHRILGDSTALLEELDGLQSAFADLDELKNYRVDQFDIGYAVLSTLVTLLRDPDVDLGAHADLLHRLLRGAWRAYRGVEHYLGRHHVDRLYVFNGRFAALRAALRACQKQGVECLVHERGHNIHHYALFRNTLPHDLDYMQQAIRSAWQQAGPNSNREQVAHDWFARRAAGMETNFISFVARQQARQLPEDWNPRQRNVAVFTSSEDEFVSIGDSWRNPLYSNQLSGLRAILASLQTIPDDVHLYVRIHPNLIGVDNRQTREIHGLRSPRLTVVPADDPVSSYDLMRAAEKTLSFGSTAGIEATYWRKPSILAGTSFYRSLGATYNPASHDELIDLLAAELPPCPLEPALVYGHYFGSFGHLFEYFHATGVFEGTFKGHRVRPGPLTRTGIWLARRPASLRRKILRVSDRLRRIASAGEHRRRAA